MNAAALSAAVQAKETSNPELGREIVANGIRTNCHDVGSGAPVVLLHGSGPGVTGWANWRGIIPPLSRRFRVVAPDIVGFGYTERPAGVKYGIETWVAHALGVLDALGLKQADVVGNSFGGALALALAIRYPDRIRRLVLMGSAGVSFPLTEGLDAVWGYEPSIQNMRRLLDIFAFDRNLVNDQLAELRYTASVRPGVQEAYASMFPAPRQRWIDALASPEADIAGLRHRALVIHGREDKVVPTITSQKLFQLIPDAQLHMFGKCGHWTQIEHAERFARLVEDFLSED
jgi:2-hydroxymuconate-semialdehyde hydrolase